MRLDFLFEGDERLRALERRVKSGNATEEEEEAWVASLLRSGDSGDLGTGKLGGEVGKVERVRHPSKLTSDQLRLSAKEHWNKFIDKKLIELIDLGYPKERAQELRDSYLSGDFSVEEFLNRCKTIFYFTRYRRVFGAPEEENVSKLDVDEDDFGSRPGRNWIKPRDRRR